MQNKGTKMRTSNPSQGTLQYFSTWNTLWGRGMLPSHQPAIIYKNLKWMKSKDYSKTLWYWSVVKTERSKEMLSETGKRHLRMCYEHSQESKLWRPCTMKIWTYSDSWLLRKLRGKRMNTTQYNLKLRQLSKAVLYMNVRRSCPHFYM